MEWDESDNLLIAKKKLKTAIAANKELLQVLDMHIKLLDRADDVITECEEINQSDSVTCYSVPQKTMQALYRQVWRIRKTAQEALKHD